MPTVVPSQIVQYIDTSLSHLKPTQGVRLYPSTCGQLNALLRLIEQLPNSLLPSDPNTYAEFIQSQESLRFAIKRTDNWNFRSGSPPPMQPDGEGKPSQVQIIRDALASCPDEIPHRDSAELPFIKDPDFRKTLLIDLEASRSALANGEWKAATVLAGSLVEALLLWAVQQKTQPEIQGACSDALTSGRLQKQPSSDPLNWGLHEFVEIAKQLNVIKRDTATQSDLAKDFRNLIHPGRQLRTQQSCDRGTALAASSAVELVSRDVQEHFR